MRGKTAVTRSTRLTQDSSGLCLGLEARLARGERRRGGLRRRSAAGKNGGRVQVSGSARKKARVRVWRAVAGGGPPRTRGAAGWLCPLEALRDSASRTIRPLNGAPCSSPRSAAFGRNCETFGGTLIKPNAARACKLQTRVCGACTDTCCNFWPRVPPITVKIHSSVVELQVLANAVYSVKSC